MRSHSLTFSLTVVLGLTQGCASPGDSTPQPARDSQQAPAASADSLVAVGDRARIIGDSTAPLWVVVVSDFQCPFCKVWHDETYPALKREFVDKGVIRLAYVNLPLPQHQHARATAELALCAGAQGRFWEYHDALFDTQAEWSALPAGTRFFDGLAGRAGVDSTRMRSCMQAGTMRALVEADYQKGVEAKVRSTPTFMIGNDIRLEGAEGIDAFRAAIANARARSGTPGSR
jgi:protein-disulfide isomerase